MKTTLAQIGEAAGLVFLSIIRGMTLHYLSDPEAYDVNAMINETNQAIRAYLLPGHQ